MTPAQVRLLILIGKHSARDARKPGSNGWIEAWDAADSWGQHMSIHLLPNAFWKVYKALERRELIEQHPEHGDLIRPTRAGWREIRTRMEAR